MTKTSHILVTAVGRDRPGLIAGLTTSIAEIKGNIEDLDSVVLRGPIFVMSMVVDIRRCDETLEQIRKIVVEKGKELELIVNVYDIRSFEAKK